MKRTDWPGKRDKPQWLVENFFFKLDFALQSRSLEVNPNVLDCGAKLGFTKISALMIQTAVLLSKWNMQNSEAQTHLFVCPHHWQGWTAESGYHVPHQVWGISWCCRVPPLSPGWWRPRGHQHSGPGPGQIAVEKGGSIPVRRHDLLVGVIYHIFISNSFL